MRCVRNVFFSLSALSPSLAAAINVSPLNDSRFASPERAANFGRDDAEFIFFRFAEVRFFGFRIECYEDDCLNIRQIEINHSSSATFSNPSAGETHPGFAKTARASNEITFFRLCGKLVLERRIVIVWQF